MSNPPADLGAEVFLTLDDASTASKSHPLELVEYAHAFLRTDLDFTRFLWLSAKTWFAVSLERRAGFASKPRALLMYREMQLPGGVTNREVDILTLLALGLTNGEIAARLGTSIRTVATQIERLLGKLQQGNRAGLSALAVDWGLLRLPIPGGTTGLSGLRLVDIERSRTAAHKSVAGERPDFSFLGRRPFLLGTIAGSIGRSTAHTQEVIRGSSLAVNQLNAAGGVAGRRIDHRVVHADLYDAESVRTAVIELIEQGVDAITASFATAGRPEILDLIGQYGCPYLHTDTYEHSVELVRNEPRRLGAVFQTCPSEVHYAEGLIEFLRELTDRGQWTPHKRTILSINVEADEHDAYANSLSQFAQEAGWSVVSTIISGPESTDWAPALREIARLQPDAVAIAHPNAEAVAPLQRAIAELSLPVLVYYVYGPSTSDFASDVGGGAEGVIWSTVTGRYEDEIGRRFHREYTSMYGSDPGWSASSAAYDQVKLLATAWAAEGTADFQTVSKFLRSTHHRGVNGVYYFADAGQTAISYPFGTTDPSLGQALMIYQIQGGQARPLSPSPHGSIEAFRTPSWFPTTSS